MAYRFSPQSSIPLSLGGWQVKPYISNTEDEEYIHPVILLESTAVDTGQALSFLETTVVIDSILIGTDGINAPFKVPVRLTESYFRTLADSADEDLYRTVIPLTDYADAYGLPVRNTIIQYDTVAYQFSEAPEAIDFATQMTMFDSYRMQGRIYTDAPGFSARQIDSLAVSNHLFPHKATKGGIIFQSLQKRGRVFRNADELFQTGMVLSLKQYYSIPSVQISSKARTITMDFVATYIRRSDRAVLDQKAFHIAFDEEKYTFQTFGR